MSAIRTASETQPAAEPKIPKELLDQLITGPITQGEFESIYRALKKAIIERAISAALAQRAADTQASLADFLTSPLETEQAARPSAPDRRC